MFKTLLTASAALVVATPAFASPALTGEVRIGDVRDNHTDSTEYKVEFNDSVFNALNYGAELQVKQPDNAGDVKSKISFKAGPALPDIYGFRPAAYGEVGAALGRNDNFEFWGAGVKLSHKLIGPIGISVGYRHREGFTNENFNEERLNGGFSIAVSDSYSLGAQYYRTRGTSDSDAVGVSVTRKF